ncbi:hypothetical protein DSCO28_73070 (plasmid) [Desulfosarcina ovata subsp. sediminis]|uniref:Uncharacterized protein n=1 Tax=Desulfosarcina ovata subsp. sediminis TaxID=885957 RepID=A0A5K8A2S2_9BACT|nr:hypothetical protein [Desulfosarcina ovata]BBO86741.1 hypothetical protein DSCO28_73070 [Desulfosarcina ovata subsp. sediminis]
MITIENDGQKIIKTSYWSTEHAARGYIYLSINAGAFRLLLPEVQIHLLIEMTTAKEVIVSRGPWPDENKSDGIEILFEDSTDSPFCLHLMVDQCDRLPGNKDVGKQWLFAVWTREGLRLELPCYFRIVKKIPWLKPYTGRR